LADFACVASIRLPGVLDISAEGFAPALRTAAAGGDLELEAQDVTRVDAAGLQLLCAAAVEVKRRGDAVVWRSPTSAIVEGARVLGLLAFLGLPSAAALRA
jgi:anti-anti-sigma regulatory factor